MVYRSLSPLINRSFFLFGARGTGKTTWLQNEYLTDQDLYIDLLDDDAEDRYAKQPGLLDLELQQLLTEKRLPRSVIIDEVQKVPKLLDIAQKWIQKHKLRFIFTGSSSRKLKRGGGNLLGGRANTYSLFPYTSKELGKVFNLQHALEWGTLPECWSLKTAREKTSYLRSYAKTYLKEEILVEQLVRKLPPFRNFLDLLAQNDGKLINFELFSKNIGVDNKTIQSYVDILEETYIGILLRPHHPSLRKSQLQQPKFYFFDQGIKRQLNGTLGTPLLPSTIAYGNEFESWMIHEMIRTVTYAEKDYRFSFYRSKHGAEVDLILTKGRNHFFIEIKSTDHVDITEVNELARLTKEFKGNKRIFYVSRDTKSIQSNGVECHHYVKFLKILEEIN
jgi:predicted AAA+ superfamily ATPase